MNQGIEILLARMDSHPQEFSSDIMLGRYGRWSKVIDQVLAVGGSFTGEEREALATKLREVERERFTQRVMKQLLDGPEVLNTVHVRRPRPYTVTEESK
jgi:ATP-dependent DNA ligase